VTKGGSGGTTKGGSGGTNKAGRIPAVVATLEGCGGTNRVHADIDALKGFHEALVRFRYAQRGVAERGGDEIEMTRASLAAKASRWQSRLEQERAELEACRAGGAQDAADCSAYARAVEQTRERLEHIHRWQQRVDTEADAFGGTAGVFLDLLENGLPRAETQLLALITNLEAARRVQAGGS
jgi:hypothetical protein